MKLNEKDDGSLASAMRALGDVVIDRISWRPVETAPQGECEILAWDGFNVFQAYWYGKHGVTSRTSSKRPWITHWMPLPLPPEQA